MITLPIPQLTNFSNLSINDVVVGNGWLGGGRKKMVRTRGRGRTRRGGLSGDIGAATADVKVVHP